MVTNALSPMRAIEALQDLVTSAGLIGAMSSGQGSIGNNENGMREVYRGSKAALNMFMSGFAARQSGHRAGVRADGVRLDPDALGGPECALHHRGNRAERGGRARLEAGNARLQYLDRLGRTVPW